MVEEERRPGGALETVATVFLAGAECPFTCVFCDLWKHTLEGPTPVGALPAQLRRALADPSLAAARPTRIKLYNASNFFDAKAVPPADWPVLAELLRPFSAVTVECHPNLVGPATVAFARLLSSRLEVAMGLETADEAVLGRLNKQVGPQDFARAASFLGGEGIDVRAFVLLGTPFVPRGDAVASAVRSVAQAARTEAAVTAIIPVRGGNGEMERLAAEGHFIPASLADLEEALAVATTAVAGLPGDPVVLADLWDARSLHSCPACRDRRIERLSLMNLTGREEARVQCAACARGA